MQHATPPQTAGTLQQREAAALLSSEFEALPPAVKDFLRALADGGVDDGEHPDDVQSAMQGMGVL